MQNKIPENPQKAVISFSANAKKCRIKKIFCREKSIEINNISYLITIPAMKL
jgi:hypothetical protein